MAGESYDYYIRMLKLPRSASEQDIKDALSKELKLWIHKTNAPKLETRQEAERKVKTLEDAEKVLLGPEGQIVRSQAGLQTAEQTQLETSVDAETVARAIERVTTARGTKAQERKGTVLYRRATIFYRGVDYLFEELVHKKYESAQDRKRMIASQGALVLFEWFLEASTNPGQGKTSTYIQGPWIVDIIAFAAECEGG